MKARHDHASTGSPHHHRWRVTEIAYLVAQLRLDDLQFVAVKITGKLEVVYVVLVVDLPPRRRRATLVESPPCALMRFLYRGRARREGQRPQRISQPEEIGARRSPRHCCCAISDSVNFWSASS